MGFSARSAILSIFISFLAFSTSLAISSSVHDDFVQCLSLQQPSIPVPIYTPNTTNYTTVFRSSARNLRYLSPTSRQPEVIITPSHESHVQAAVVCCKKHGLDLKVRSGGHDVEGLSYISDKQFVIVDLVNYRNVTIDLKDNTAWVQAGASLGEVYYKIANKSKTLGFPGGFCPTVGVGGHISGGGFGALVRKYGLASDQVIDAYIVTVDGKILNKENMGEDLFWAIRGGGASSFGVILSWKIKLVPVPTVVTVATVDRTVEQGATGLVHKWQYIADKLDPDLYLALTFTPANSTSRKGEKTVQAQFSILFLGGVDKLLQIMEASFPELGLKRNDTMEMSWVESHIYFYRRGSPLELLMDRDPIMKSFLKVKSDYVKEPISEAGLEEIWKRYIQGDINGQAMLFTPFGGRMNEISEFASPYPHRAGNIYNIMYVANWLQESESEKQLDWLRKFYSFMGQYVSKFPRTTYLNYKDLDVGVNSNKDGVSSYLDAKIWGTKYFKLNFERLVLVKTTVDPGNFFKNKQSIPSITSEGM